MSLIGHEHHQIQIQTTRTKTTTTRLLYPRSIVLRAFPTTVSPSPSTPVLGLSDRSTSYSSHHFSLVDETAVSSSSSSSSSSLLLLLFSSLSTVSPRARFLLSSPRPSIRRRHPRLFSSRGAPSFSSSRPRPPRREKSFQKAVVFFAALALRTRVRAIF